MSKKGIIVSCLLSVFILALYIVNVIYTPEYDEITTAYQVYLDGYEIGLIKSSDELYNKIDDEQQEIKNKYGVSSVYPPSGLEVVAVKTYDDDFMNVDDVYSRIANDDNFTIMGYIITIKPSEGDNIVINVLDRSIFDEAIKKFILSFITEEQYNDYIAGNNEDVTEIGSVIKKMYFEESVTVKEGYINANDEIFTSVDSLTQYLLFGANANMDNYTVKLGDSIESISDAYKLNPQEFIIANPVYRNVNTLLRVGESVNVTLINPVLTFTYEVYKIEETEKPYSTSKKIDYTKSVGYSEVVTQGVTGLTLNHEEYKVTNGEQSSEVTITKSEEIRAVQNEEVIIGPSYSGITGSYVEIPGDWGWPTNSGYIITSRYYYRWGKLHEGIDISGTGYGSPIYAIADGTVVQVTKYCGKNNCTQWYNGNFIYIDHGNGYYSAYLHLSGFNVSVGQKVKKGDVIAFMGNSGYVTGTHLHLGLFVGYPSNKGNSLDPLKTIYKGIK